MLNEPYTPPKLTKEQVQFIRLVAGISPEACRIVPVKKMPSDVKRYTSVNRYLERHCYKNAALAMMAIEALTEKEAHYILGIADLALGFIYGHAWIEVDGQHYDPTFEVAEDWREDRLYCELVRFSAVELALFLESNDQTPPCYPDDIPESLTDHFVRDRFKEMSQLYGSKVLDFD